ncbi:hypothetical protein SAMN06296010_2724 [Agreia pratensis]|uniref:Uncharacterized protein n=1 Tax=Agreia pratensis TaxID=150121 RepID=A0A1X7KNP3_9MICO|nr:hypothetical protein SAMN06296010_2724 [Agreia pratensis]
MISESPGERAADTGEPFAAAEPSWWRRNRWSVLALAVLLPGTVIVTTSSEWFDYQNRLYSHAVTVPDGESAVYGGAEFRVHDTVLVRGGTEGGDELELDPDMDLIVAVLDVTPGKGSVDSCDLTISATSPGHPEKRAWNANVDLPRKFPPTGDAQTTCSDSQGEPYRLVVAATIPGGAAESKSWVHIEKLGLAPDYLELELSPSAVSSASTSSDMSSSATSAARRDDLRQKSNATASRLMRTGSTSKSITNPMG